MLADYDSTGLSLKLHPLALLRKQSTFGRCKQAQQLAELNHGRFVRVAGLVTGRQRPGSAAGVVFLTLEDETGSSNIVVWRRVQDNFRQALMSGQLLLVTGTVETKDNVTHVIAGALQDYTAELDRLRLKSRDFQ